MTESLCIKCQQSASIHIRRTWYCSSCFLNAMKIRFDSAMGNAAQGKRIRSKGLIILHDNASSTMLMDLCVQYLKEASLLTFKKRSFQLDDLILASTLDLQNISKDLKFIKVSLEDDLEKTWGSASARQDAKDILELKMFADLATRNGCDALIFPDTCTDLAIRSISDTCLGKGLAMSSNISPFHRYVHNGQPLLLIRPLHEVTDQDVLLYNKIIGIESNHAAIQEKVIKEKQDSIQNATRTFLMQLEKEHPSTINIISKTCLKLSQPLGDLTCSFCNGPRSKIDSEWRKSHTLVKTKNSSKLDSIFEDFCYSCQNILLDLKKKEDQIPEFMTRLLSMADMEKEISEFLL